MASKNSNVEIRDSKDWDRLVLDSIKNPHYMQAAAWGDAKNELGWPVSRYVLSLANHKFPLQIFSRGAPGLGNVYYSPEVVGINTDNISHFTKEVKKVLNHGLVYKLELFQPYSEELIAAFGQNGWEQARSVQHRNTVIVDLTGSEEELFMSIKKRARYEVRSARKSGVRTEKVPTSPENLKKLTNLLHETARRTGGFFRSDNYTETYWDKFREHNQASLYFAWHSDELIAAAYIIEIGEFAWYKDGGSDLNKPELMAPRLLLWGVMVDLQKRGVKKLDLSGIPGEEDRETSPLRGLYAFKTGFSKEKTQLMPAFELSLGKLHKIWPTYERKLLRAYSGLKKDFWY